MREHPLVTAAKLGLLAMILLALIFHFVGINETQTKVIETATRLESLKEQVTDLERDLAVEGKAIGQAIDALDERMSSGVIVSNGGAGATKTTEPKAGTDPYAGYEELLTDEQDMPRPPDEEIDFDAQFRTATSGKPKGLNIYTSDRTQTVAVRLGFYIYAPLAERHNADQDRYKPGLATSVLRSPDKKTYIMKLRKGVYWQRPAVDLANPKYQWMKGRREVTADDLVFALDMILDTRADTDSIRDNFAKIESYEAVDPHTLRVTWKEKNFYSRGALLDDLKAFPKWIYTREEDGTKLPAASIAPRFGTHWFNQNMCGYGSYLVREYKLSDYLLLERNERYWGRRPAFKQIFWKIKVVQDEPRYNMFMKKDANGKREQDQYAISAARFVAELRNNPKSALKKQLNAKELYIWSYQRKMFAYTGWACRSKFFNDKRVRVAMTMASNRNSWRDDILHGHARFPTGDMFPPSPEYDKSIPPRPYDLEKAAALLDAAGWRDTDGNGVREKMIQGQKVEFRFKVLQTEPQPAIGAMNADWRQSLRKIGVIMVPDVVEWAQLLKRVRDREFDAFSMGWFLGDDYRPRQVWHSSHIEVPGSYNYAQWKNERGDEIMDQLEIEFDVATRRKLCHEFHRIFYEDNPITLTWSWKNPVAFDSRIGGMRSRVFAPQVDYRDIWWQKNGPAKYPPEFSKVR